MKRIVLILCCMVSAFSLPIFAQQAITQAIFPYDITKTIVKEHTYPNTVNYVETMSAHYFAYADASLTVSCHEIDPNIFVRDFRILNDTVYFCGYDMTGVCKGIWGFFRVADLTAGSMTYKTHIGFGCGKEYVDTLHSLVAYYANGKKHIVAVGTTTDGTVKNGCTIDMTPSTGGIYGWNYTIGVTPKLTDERIKYVCETDNLVVTAGSSTVFIDVEIYRIHNKGNIFSAGGPQNTISFFSYSSTDPFVRNTDKFAVTHMNGDTMAMAFQSKNSFYFYNTPPYYNHILYYEYDMSTLVNGMINTVNSLAVFTYEYPLDVEGLVYSAPKNSLSVLVKGNLAYPPLYGYGSIVAEIVPGSSSVNLHGLPDIELHSIDNYNLQQNYVCLGKDILNPKHATYYTQPLNTDIGCTNNFPFSGSTPVFMTKQHDYPYSLCSDSFNMTMRGTEALEVIPNEIKCQ